MAQYYLIFIVLSSLSWLTIIDCGNKRLYSTSFISVLIIFALFGAIRWETGTDWLSYLNLFNRTSDWDDLFILENIEFETGFIILNLFSHYICTSYSLCLTIQSAIIFFLLYKSLQQQSILPLVSLFIYFSMSLAGIFFVRQTIALVILLYATKYIYNRKLWHFITYIFIASLFHRTASIYILAYMCCNWKLSWSQMIIILGGAAILGTFSSKLILGTIGSVNLGVFSGKLNAYLLMGAEDNSTIYSTAGTLIRATINRGLIFIMFWLLIKNKKENDPIVNGLINIYFVGACLYFILAPVALSLARVTAYFDIVQVLIIPYFFIKHKIPERAIVFVIIFIYSAFRLYVALTSHPDAYIPYKTIFS